MNIRHVILAAAAMSAGLLNIGLAAAPALALPSGTAEVAYQDLNLTHAAGRVVLDRRIALAARQVCGNYAPVELTWSALSRACQEDAIAAVQPQLNALVGERQPTVRVSRSAF